MRRIRRKWSPRPQLQAVAEWMRFMAQHPSHLSQSCATTLPETPLDGRGLPAFISPMPLIYLIPAHVDESPSKSNISTMKRRASTHGVDLLQVARNCRRRGGSVGGGVSAMGPRHASGGLGRMPNPGLAVCAGQRARASGDRAYMDVLAAPPAAGPTPPSHRKPAFASAVASEVAGQRPALPRVPGAARPSPHRPCGSGR